MDDSSYHGLWRMDWGLGNPNTTAALIATIMIAAWTPAYIRKWGFWVALALFTGFGACIVLTLSRGGLVGLIGGCLCVLAWAPRPLPVHRSISVAGACIALIIFALFINAPTRYSQGLATTDRSIDNRLLIWEQVPAMIHDAPNGWGIGKSGEAYMQWYQPITRGEGYRTLVNSHLTWLVELNWWGRIAYIFSLITILIILWPRSDHHWYSVPFGIWIAFGVCSVFSSIAEMPLLWVIPALALVSVLISRLRSGLWPDKALWVGGGLAAIAVIAGIFLLGNCQSASSNINCLHDGIVTLGPIPPKIWIVAPNRNVLGEHYGHEVRRGYDTNPVFHQTGLGIVSLLQNAPTNEALVFSGQVPRALDALHPAQVILINPKPASSDVLSALLMNPNITVVVGEFSRNKDYWSQQSQEHPNLKVQLVTGSEEYIPNWMQQVADAIKN